MSEATQQLASGSIGARLRVAALLLLGLAPIALMLYFVVTRWLPLPFWDEWNTPGALFVSWYSGTLTLSDLFAQHNESRGFFPRVLHLLLLQFGGWDVRREMAILFASVCATTALFYRAMRRVPGATTSGALVAWVAAAFLCFSAVQFDNFLYATLLGPFTPGLGLMAVLAVNTSRRSFGQKCALNAAIALVATYTFANGILLWLLGVPLRRDGEGGSRAKSVAWLAGYALCAVLAVGLYFVGYTRPGHHPDFLPQDKGFVAVAHYLLLWIGSYFKAAGVDPLLVGITAVSLFAVLFVGALLLIWRSGAWRPFYAALVIAAYACLTAGITAAGRVGFGVEQALDLRYRAFSVFFYLAIVALFFAIYCSDFRERDRPRRLFLGACGITAAVALLGWIVCYRDGLSYLALLHGRNVTLLRALQWIEVIPDNPDFHYLYSDRQQLIERTRILRQHNVLRLGFVKENLARKVRRSPPADVTEEFGRIEICMFDTNHNLYMTGWARLPVVDRPADCVVVGVEDSSGTFKPISLLETYGGRKTFKTPRLRRVTFSRTFSPANVPAGDIVIGAWAIDQKNKKAYPLAGSRPISGDQR